MLYCHLLIVFTVKDSELNLKESIGDLLSRVHTFNILKQQIATKAQFKKRSRRSACMCIRQEKEL